MDGQSIQVNRPTRIAFTRNPTPIIPFPIFLLDYDIGEIYEFLRSFHSFVSSSSILHS